MTDHRINLTLYKLDQVMAGDLDEVIDALIGRCAGDTSGGDRRVSDTEAIALGAAQSLQKTAYPIRSAKRGMLWRRRCQKTR